jgi:uncharacterized protein involved in outer membrane biogenesis
MKKIIKIPLILVIVIVVFVGGAALLANTIINQGEVKNTIVRLVHDKTGRELAVKGEMYLSFFPWLGVKAQDVTLSSAPGFKKTDFAKVGELNISVKLLPLVFGRVEADHLRIKGLKLSFDGSEFADGLMIKKLSVGDLSVVMPSDSSSKNLLGKIKLSADLEINEMQIKKLKFDNFFAEINVDEGLINMSKIKFGFYRGRITGSASVDGRGTVPKSNLKLVFKRVVMLPVLTDVAKYEDFSGDLTANVNISTRGVTGKSIINNLNGSGNVVIDNGVYRGVDVVYEVRQAHAILNQKPMPEKSQSSSTDFDRFTANFKINNALLNINDLLIVSPDYKVTGKGSVNLSSQHLDLQLVADSHNDKNFFVPIKISGPFAKPSIKPDVAVIAGPVVKKEIKKQLGKQLEKLNISGEIIKSLPLDKLFR